MSLADYRKVKISNFRGWWSLVDETDVGVGYALNARNVRYTPGKVGSRYGHKVAFTSLGGVTSLYHWISSDFSALVYFESGNTAKLRILESKVAWLTPGTTYTLFTQNAYSVSVAEAGKRAFIASFNSSGLGAGQCRVVDLATSLSGYNAFPPPLVTVPVITELPNTGRVTAGSHKIGYVLTTLSGFAGKPGPAPGDVFTPVSFTASGGKTMTMTITRDWPADAHSLQAIMTRADNPDKWYFVPGASTFVPPGAVGWSAVVTIDYPDSALVANEADLDASEQFLLLTQTVGGTGPFNPSVVIAYGTRMVFVVDDTVYISDPGNYQTLTLDEHTKVLPGKKRVITGFALGTTLYLLGPRWTYALSDNGDRPSTWATPREIDGQIGALGPLAVTVSTTGGYGWVADESGLYLFNGLSYPELPISYYNSPEWNRINKAAAHTIQVVDDHIAHCVYVIAPLDAATSPSHIFKWDYHDGKRPESVQFSLDSIQAYSIGAVGLLQDPVTKRLVRWIAPAGAGEVLAEDPTSRNDGARAIASDYETCLVPPESSRVMEVNTLRAYAMRVKGSGTLNLTAHTLDHAISDPLLPVELKINPGLEEIRRLEQLTPQGSLEMGTNEVDGWWEMTRLTPYWSDWGNR